MPRAGRELDHNRNLPLREIHFGERLVVITDRCYAQRLRHRGCAHAEFSGTCAVRAHRDFGPNKACRGRDAAQVRNGAQILFHVSRGRGQRVRIITAQNKHIFFARSTQAHLATHTGNRLQRFAHLRLNRLLAHGAFAALGELNGQRGFAYLRQARWRKRIAARSAAADGGVRRFDVLHFGHQKPRLLCGCHRFFERRTRRQFKIDLRL